MRTLFRLLAVCCCFICIGAGTALAQDEWSPERPGHDAAQGRDAGTPSGGIATWIDSSTGDTVTSVVNPASPFGQGRRHVDDPAIAVHLLLGGGRDHWPAGAWFGHDSSRIFGQTVPSGGGR
jgi:hypothetical protein